MSSSLTLTLNDGRTMPQFGLGVFKLEPTAALVEQAVGIGYRCFDTASRYGNEAEVAAGLRATGVDGFITTKLWMDELGYDEALRACERSLERLGRDCIDLYLIHWPQAHLGLHVETWRALIRLREEGRVKSIGASNFEIPHLQDLIAATGVVPALNQVELHPYFQQKALRAFHRANGIVTQGWSPLGRGAVLHNAVITDIAAKHQCTPAQVVLRWHLQSGCAVIPKASSVARLQENWEAQNIALDAADMAQIEALDSEDGRTGPHPDNVEAWLQRRS